MLFFPDQHLGRNTAFKMGFKSEDMVVWNPREIPDTSEISKARFVLWHGYCSVHQRFTVNQIQNLRESHPDAMIVVHPECDRKVVQAADADGSTDFIRRYCEDAPQGSVIGVGTEINLVQRLNSKYPNKEILCLDDSICPCSTMYMIHPAYLLDVLEKIRDGSVPNQIIVPEQTAKYALIALERMLSITS